MEKAALLIIDAQQEYFAPVGKLVLPNGPKAVKDLPGAFTGTPLEEHLRKRFMTQTCCDTTTQEAAHRPPGEPQRLPRPGHHHRCANLRGGLRGLRGRSPRSKGVA